MHISDRLGIEMEHLTQRRGSNAHSQTKTAHGEEDVAGDGGNCFVVGECDSGQPKY